MKSKYRINTQRLKRMGVERYVIQKKRKFLWWSWWSKITKSVYGLDGKLRIKAPLRFKTYEQALEHLNTLPELP